MARKFAERDAAFAARPALLGTRHELYLGDARSMLELDAGRKLHLVVTSPPYWTLKNYEGTAGPAQLGAVQDYERFQLELAKVWRRCFDLLVPGGRLCVVVGDVCLPRKSGGRHRVVPLHADIASHCGRIGFDYLTPILWHKIANAVTEVEGNGAAFLGKPYEPNAIIKNDVEYVLLFRKPGAYRSPTEEQRRLSLIDKNDHAAWFRSIWTDIPGASGQKGHPAPFPVKLAYRLIRMFSFVGDTVLDPFVGSGSTTQGAIQAYRSSVGYEIEPYYFDQLKQRFSQFQAGIEITFGG
ncbi:MAG TPA: site-specific DNA-methyltransferase [Gemmatimonadales bacterium]|nr:site-specific DNA-methyltransferase [Gemmatimonadales bacterium]